MSRRKLIEFVTEIMWLFTGAVPETRSKTPNRQKLLRLVFGFLRCEPPPPPKKALFNAIYRFPHFYFLKWILMRIWVGGNQIRHTQARRWNVCRR